MRIPQRKKFIHLVQQTPFQLCAKHKSWKSSLRLFFDLFHLRFTSQDNFRNHGLICFHQVNHWFDPFALDWGDFLRHFLGVRPLTPATHLVFCYLPVDSPFLCRILYLKYQSKIHINQDAHSYCTQSGSFSADDVTKKEEI